MRLANAYDTRCVRPTSASRHTDYEHPRLVCSRFVMRACGPNPQFGEFGGSRHRDSLRRVQRLFLRRGRFLPQNGESLRPSLWHSCRASVSTTALSHALTNDRLRRDRISHNPRDGTAMSAIRSAFPRQVTAPCARVPFPTASSGSVFSRSRGFATAGRFSAFLRPQTLSPFSVPLPCGRKRVLRRRLSAR